VLLDRFRLDGKRVLIAGGCGLVGQICVETVMGLEGDPITLDMHPSAHYRYNLSNRFVVHSLPDKIRPVDVLINCQVGNQKSVTNPENHWEDDIANGLTAVENVCYAFGTRMAALEGGVILNFGSDLSHIAPDHSLYSTGHFKPASYSAVKAGVVGLTRYFATLWPNVRCNCLCPGGIDRGQKVPENPLKRLMQPNELKGPIALLISQAGSYMNGAIVNVDGGRTAI
jgi:NAD(P)-dependent dehydrogenase (short-subunit alcohol dehydrogenase family)